MRSCSENRTFPFSQIQVGMRVHVKALLRRNTAQGVRLLPEGTPVFVTVKDARDKVVDDRVIKVGAWSTAEWTFTVPGQGSLGSYTIRAVLEGDKPKPTARPGRAYHRRRRPHRPGPPASSRRPTGWP